jgi:hypothetical protein
VRYMTRRDGNERARLPDGPFRAVGASQSRSRPSNCVRALTRALPVMAEGLDHGIGGHWRSQRRVGSSDLHAPGHPSGRPSSRARLTASVRPETWSFR